MSARRSGRAVALVLAGSCLAAGYPGVAAGDAPVQISGGDSSVTVTPQAGADGDHGVIVEPFKENAGRDGFRVRPDGFGRPAFSEDETDCQHNFIDNDVVCTGARSSVVVTTGDGADTVVASETPGGNERLGRIDQTVVLGSFSRTIPAINPAGLTTNSAGG